MRAQRASESPDTYQRAKVSISEVLRFFRAVFGGQIAQIGAMEDIEKNSLKALDNTNLN